MNNNILLTGGLGYIGSNIAVKLLESNYNVYIIDNLSNSTIDRLDTIEKISNKKVNFMNIDMNDMETLDYYFNDNNIDIVIHLAGYKSVGCSVKDPLLYYSNNINITLNLLTVMQKYKCFKLIFSSSATVYGNMKSPVNEMMITGINLTNPYGKTKYMIEEILKDMYISNKNFNIVILRYFNPIGMDKSRLLYDNPNGVPNNLFPYIFKVYKKELDKLNIFGSDYNTKDGTCIRDFIHIQDLADGHISSIDFLLRNNNGIEIFNLGTGNQVSVLDVVCTFEKVNNVKILYKITNRREGDVDITYADSTKANNILNWKPKFSLEDMVKI
jgi:UDP-glucose 4-epimerase